MPNNPMSQQVHTQGPGPKSMCTFFAAGAQLIDLHCACAGIQQAKEQVHNGLHTRLFSYSGSSICQYICFPMWTLAATPCKLIMMPRHVGEFVRLLLMTANICHSKLLW